MDEKADKVQPQTSWLETWVERGLRFVDDLGTIGKLAVIPAIAILILVPGAIQQRFDPVELVRSTVFLTMPLTLAVGLIFVASFTGFIKTGYGFVAMSGVALTICANVAIYYGCADCSGLIDAAHEAAYDWTPKFIRGEILGGGIVTNVIFIVVCLFKYIQLYHLGGFLASIVCGVFLGLSLMWLFRPISHIAKT
jgi:hypothetical protein